MSIPFQITGGGSGGASTWDSIQNAAGNLVLANGTNTTEFDQTNAATWTWKNTTPATAAGAASNSPSLIITGQAFVSGATADDKWTINQTLDTPLVYTITNSSETSGSVVTLTIGTHNLKVGQTVTLTGLTWATWLNNQNVAITSVAGTTITFTDPTSHGTSASHADAGTVTQQPMSYLNLTHSGSAGGAQIKIPTGAANGGPAGEAWGALQDSFSNGISFGPIAATTWAFCGKDTNIKTLQFRNNTTLTGQISWSQNTGPVCVNVSSQQGNAPLLLTGTMTTQNTGTVHIGNGSNQSYTATAGEQSCVLIGDAKQVYSSSASAVFAPTSGNANFTIAGVLGTINQTGSASGSYTALKVNIVETAVLGTSNKLLDLQTGGTSRLAITNSGKLVMPTTNTATTATAGANGDVPAQVVGYLIVNIGGTDRKIPYYAV